ncbi:hypothetical protein [Helicobacter sp. MIT 14-3879]|uniref:hypothetical protein n=1 Tax=Helicobacter sp. MIT 14-3879 TaxID=2040649 RepID=UPI000E1E5A45|nr:hypothetical protein [Helicobacter sp. MIT 14-3879]RDU58961.1 hypothetical protein CQA44_11850 [Helicobacter sp. MIT 14-3879]
MKEIKGSFSNMFVYIILLSICVTILYIIMRILIFFINKMFNKRFSKSLALILPCYFIVSFILFQESSLKFFDPQYYIHKTICEKSGIYVYNRELYEKINNREYIKITRCIPPIFEKQSYSRISPQLEAYCDEEHRYVYYSLDYEYNILGITANVIIERESPFVISERCLLLNRLSDRIIYMNE